MNTNAPNAAEPMGPPMTRPAAPPMAAASGADSAPMNGSAVNESPAAAAAPITPPIAACLATVVRRELLLGM